MSQGIFGVQYKSLFHNSSLNDMDILRKMHSFLSVALCTPWERPSCSRVTGISCTEAQIEQKQRGSESIIFFTVETSYTDASSSHPDTGRPRSLDQQVLIRHSQLWSPSQVKNHALRPAPWLQAVHYSTLGAGTCLASDPQHSALCQAQKLHMFSKQLLGEVCASCICSKTSLKSFCGSPGIKSAKDGGNLQWRISFNL